MTKKQWLAFAIVQIAGYLLGASTHVSYLVGFILLLPGSFIGVFLLYGAFHLVNQFHWHTPTDTRLADIIGVFVMVTAIVMMNALFWYGIASLNARFTRRRTDSDLRPSA